MADDAPPSLPFSTLVHMITIRLNSENFLLWRKQVISLLEHQHLYHIVDGSVEPPPQFVQQTFTTATSPNLRNGVPVPNPRFTQWRAQERNVNSLLLSSLTEEALSETLSADTARDVWNALHTAYASRSKARELRLRDELQLMRRGSLTVTEYGKKFRTICDQLAAIGAPVANDDKVHWFLRGLGPSYANFSTGQLDQVPLPLFTDILCKVESHSIFQASLEEPTPPPPAAFYANNPSRSSGNQSSRGGSRGNSGGGSNGGNRGNSNNGSRQRRNNGGSGRRGNYVPRCQICREQGHYADKCPVRWDRSFESANLAQAFSAGCSLDNSDKSDWFMDTGATAHMTPSSSQLTETHEYTGNDRVRVGNGNSLHITHIGSRSLPHSVPLSDVLVVPRLTKNLVSVSQLTRDNNAKAIFVDDSFVLQNRKTGVVLARGRCDQGLYVLDQGPQALLTTSSPLPRASFELWHSRLGHVNFDVINTLQKQGCLQVSSLLPKPICCTTCQMAKSKRLVFYDNNKRASTVLDLIHCDLWGPAPVASVDGYSYFVIFVDDFSRFTWFYPLRRKSDFYNVLLRFKAFVENQFSRSIKIFQSDNGTEFTNNKVQNLFASSGVLHRFSCPHTQAQNGRVERKHRHILEIGLAMLYQSHVPTRYWVDAFSSAVYIINRVPSQVLAGQIPFTLLFQVAPAYANFHPFGCRVFPCLRPYMKNKFSPRSSPCIFLGYSSHHKGFKCFDPTTSRIYVSRHAQFDEFCFPFAGSHSSDTNLVAASFYEPSTGSLSSSMTATPPAQARSLPAHPLSCPSCVILDAPQLPHHDAPPSPEIGSPPRTPSPVPVSPVVLPASPIAPIPPAPAPARARTRSQNGIFRPNPRYAQPTALLSALHATSDPKGFKSAMKHPQWLAAMEDEISALHKNNTWTLVSRPSATNVVGSKWVFRTKHKSDGTVERLKARLVAQGFTQIPGFDYSLTFSPVVKATTVRLILSLAVLNGWELHQLDVKNAFLHGHLTETVYMEQPPGFVDPRFPTHVCRLNKALYGLKQAPRAWFQRLSSFLLRYGFVCSRADPSLFFFYHGHITLYLLVYVDDIILTGSDSHVLHRFITSLHAEFAIKYLGKLGYFLGLEITYTADGLFLGQAKYAHDLLSRAMMLEASHVSTPLAAGSHLVSGGVAYSDPTHYRSLVGALQYLTITRPDLSYAVNTVSQFLQAPSVDHFQAVKRILRYVCGTQHFGLTFRRSSSPAVLGYSDADWARCTDTRRSTYGYAIFLGDHLLSWSAKKQPTVARSSCESEYRVMANTASELVWLINLLRELRVIVDNSASSHRQPKCFVYGSKSGGS